MIRQKRTNYAKYMAYLRDHEPNGPRPQAPCPSLTLEQLRVAYEENDLPWSKALEQFGTLPQPSIKEIS